MKKYIAPSLKVVNIVNNAILAGSFGNANDTQGYTGRPGGFSRRGRNLDWDDDDEE